MLSQQAEWVLPEKVLGGFECRALNPVLVNSLRFADFVPLYAFQYPSRSHYWREALAHRPEWHDVFVMGRSHTPPTNPAGRALEDAETVHFLTIAGVSAGIFKWEQDWAEHEDWLDYWPHMEANYPDELHDREKFLARTKYMHDISHELLASKHVVGPKKDFDRAHELARQWLAEWEARLPPPKTEEQS